MGKKKKARKCDLSPGEKSSRNTLEMIEKNKLAVNNFKIGILNLFKD